MTLQEAKDYLKDNYVKAGLKVTDENLDTIYFLLDEEKFKISKEDIEGYKNFKNSKEKFLTVPNECSLVSKNYREQIVNFLSLQRRNLRRARTKYTFGNPEGEHPFIEISPASDTFVNYFRFESQYLDISLEVLSYSGSNDDEPHEELFDELYRPTTIKVFNIKESSVENSIAKSNILIDGCLFSISSLLENPVELIEEWPITKSGIKSSKDFVYGEKIEIGNTLPIPNIKLNSVLVKFHQQATSTDIPSLQFLAYYQVLEYFFLQVADEQLYHNLSRRINDLKFKTTPNHLDKLIQDVTNHKRENDETEMLKNVLKKFVSEDDVIDFIKQYEEFLEKKIYTIKREVFGVDIAAISLNTGHIFGPLAKTIKAIRNALVHSSDRYERNVRYIPYSKTGNELLQTEIPMIRFLAEKVIVASSSPL